MNDALGALQVLVAGEADDGFAVAQDEGDAAVIFGDVLGGNRRAYQPAGEIQNYRIEVVVDDGRHAVAAPHAQVVVQEARRLMHARVELRVAQFVAVAVGIVVNDEGLVGRDGRVQRKQVAHVAIGNLIALWRHAVDHPRRLDVGNRGVVEGHNSLLQQKCLCPYYSENIAGS